MVLQVRLRWSVTQGADASARAVTAKVVMATLVDLGYDVIGAWDDAPEKQGTTCLGVRVLGTVTESLAQPLPSIIAIGDNRVRMAWAARLPLPWVVAVHPTAWVHASVQLGPGSVVFAGAVIQPDTVLGAHVIVNTAASIDHDCRIGDFVHLGPGARLCGGVTVGVGVLVGVGASALPGASVGAWATVGGGAVVAHPVSDGAVVVGVPARIAAADDAT